jgi:transcriptional regulator with XRE-family HTH domain
MAIGENIKILRRQNRWSQKQLAQKIGTSGPIVGRYERGEMTPSVEVAKKLADTLNVTLAYLVDDPIRAAEIKDKNMFRRIMEIQDLNTEDQKTIVHVLDSLLRDVKAKKAYAYSPA